MAPYDTPTALLQASRNGDADAANLFFDTVYDSLRRLSQSRIAAEPGVVTLTATGLVHEVYLKLVDGSDFNDRTHFMAVAARAMRRILIDRARARKADKRGGPEPAVTLDADLIGGEELSVDRVLAIDEALDRLAARDADLARLVELRFFGGLEVAEVAEILGVSPRTAARQWARAKAHLHADLA